MFIELSLWLQGDARVSDDPEKSNVGVFRVRRMGFTGMYMKKMIFTKTNDMVPLFFGNAVDILWANVKLGLAFDRQLPTICY